MFKNLDKVTLRKLQLTEKICLDEVKRICEKNNLKYFLSCGTLLGAIRHKGFIPWDDDVDIGMMREEYDKFIECCKTDLNTEKFFLQTPYTDKGSADFELARIRLNGTKFLESHRKEINIHHGIYVEVFPYDDFPDNKIKQFFLSNSFRFWKKVVGIRMGYKYKTKSVINRNIMKFFAFLSKIIPLDKQIYKMNNYHHKYHNPNSNLVISIAGGVSYKKERHSRLELNDLTTAEFEGDLYPIPKNYNKILTEEYGDYMTPPPVEKQVNKCPVEEIDFGEY